MQNFNSKLKTDLRERCFQFSLSLIELINSLPRNLSNRIISDQILRSGTSIGANLVESSASSSRLEFKKYNEIALKSANETKYWLALLGQTNRKGQKLETLIDENDQLARMIASGILKLKGKL
jgi:four helix bundle protein